MRIDTSVIKRQPVLAQQVADFLIKEINSGNFSPNETFPSENKLAEMLNVSRTVIREALARMKHDGLLETVKGGRTKVATDPSGHVFRLDPKTYEDSNFLVHMYELRTIIEPEAAALAAARANKRTLATIEKRYDELETALKNSKDGTEESLAFHKAVMDASNNTQIAALVGWVDKKIWSFVRSNNFEHNAIMISEVQHEHKAIIETIVNGDSARARQLSRQHVIDAARRHGLKIRLP
ncbi:FadR/GntR family transcriptional regulator [Thermodesulfobacteriota bacterium]